MNWLLDNWLTILGASSVLGAPLAYIFGGRDAQKKQLKKDDVEIQKEEVDLAKDTRDYFNSFIGDMKVEKEELKEALKESKEDAKNEREYFRSQLDEVRTLVTTLQQQVNSMSIAYATELEKSQNWEKLHRELGERYNILEKEYSELKELYDKLKKDFEKYKRENK